ncbi:MAG: NERD domain-containing protein [Kouleothrix sp.]|nr:NERD domain-containing protein [Kouleothrix sp.]
MIPNVPPPTQEPSEPQDVPMSLDEAWRVRWPFDTREPMGAMFDRGTLTRSKLQWAAEKAKWPEVRRAAQTLIEELERRTAAAPAPTQAAPPPAQPTAPAPTIPRPTPTTAPASAEPPRYGARVVVASEYLEEQETFHGWLLAYYAGLGVAVAMLTLNTIFWLIRGQSAWLTALSLMANIVAWVWFAVVVRRQIQKVRSYRAGRKGEEQVVELLRQALDSRWTIYRNLQLPDRRDDLDLVLVGPGGVWAVQVKATGAPLRVQGGRWEVKRGGQWVAAKPDPGAQVKGQAKRLNDFFKCSGINRYVEAAVALAESQPFDKFEGSPIPVWLPFAIEARARQLSTRYPPSAAELERISELLSRRAVEQRAVEEARQGRRG